MKHNIKCSKILKIPQIEKNKNKTTTDINRQKFEKPNKSNTNTMNNLEKSITMSNLEKSNLVLK